MLFATLTFWMLIIVFAAWGVQRLWGGMVKPRVINIVLLPGTLVAQLGHVLGLLVTGATVSGTALYKNESGEPGTTQGAQPRIPVIGPMIIGMLPLAACTATICVVSAFLGRNFLTSLHDQRLASALPTTLAGVWQLLRDQVTMVERLVEVSAAALPGSWRLWLFIYLMICLTVRMAPFPGNVRGSLGAIVAAGACGAGIEMLWHAPTRYVESGWIILSLTVPTVVLLLLISALVRAAVGLGRIVAKNG